MGLPQFSPARISRDLPTLSGLVDSIARLQDAMVAYAQALTNDRTGLLARSLTLADNFRCEVVPLSITTPDDWVPVVPLNSFTIHPATQFGPPGVRCLPNGKCQARGLLTRSSAPAGGVHIVDLPTGFTPLAIGDKRIPVEMAGSSGAVEVLPPSPAGNQTGAITYLFGWNGFVDLSSVTWDASVFPLPMWSTDAQPLLSLPESFRGVPAQVTILDALRSDGLHSGPHACSWTTYQKNARQFVKLASVTGLVPLTKYTLTIAVFPG